MTNFSISKLETAHTHPGVVTASQRSSGYAAIAQNHIDDGWDAYAITLMFHHIPGSEGAVATVMRQEAERLYGILLTRIVRDSRSPKNKGNLPVWIVNPDYPITKREKSDKRLTTANNGRHLHGIALIPPNSRLKQPLDEHLEAETSRYVRRPLLRIDVEPIVGDVLWWVDYQLKSVNKGRADYDDVVIFPMD